MINKKISEIKSKYRIEWNLIINISG
jgi:hypothetical protein